MIDNLIEVLDRLFETDFASKDEYGCVTFTEEGNAASALCCEYLIHDGGGCNWTNINYLRKHGYSVYPGDEDSFGWLVGCISKNGKVLTFG